MRNLSLEALAVLETVQESFSEKPSEAQPVRPGTASVQAFRVRANGTVPRNLSVEGGQWDDGEDYATREAC